MSVPHASFEEKIHELKKKRGVEQDTDLTTADLKELVEIYKNVYKKGTGEDFPTGNFLLKHYHC